MTDRTKSFIIIFATLSIGFMAGFLTSSSLSRFRLSHLKGSMKAQEKFEENIARSLDLSNAQREAIRPILGKRFPEIREIQRNFGSQMRLKMDSLQTDIIPYLTPEQVEKMKNQPPFRPPFGRKGKHKRRKHHPPHR